MEGGGAGFDVEVEEEPGESAKRGEERYIVEPRMVKAPPARVRVRYPFLPGPRWFEPEPPLELPLKPPAVPALPCHRDFDPDADLEELANPRRRSRAS